MKDTDRKICATINSLTNNQQIDNLYEGDKIIRGTQMEYLKNHILDFNKSKRFVKIFDNVVPALSYCLKNTEIALLFKLIPLISYEDCILRKGGHGNGAILGVKEISYEIDEKLKTVRPRFNTLIECDIICEYKFEYRMGKYTQCFVFNPYLIVRGTNLKKEYTDLFKDSVWKDLYIE